LSRGFPVDSLRRKPRPGRRGGTRRWSGRWARAPVAGSERSSGPVRRNRGRRVDAARRSSVRFACGAPRPPPPASRRYRRLTGSLARRCRPARSGWWFVARAATPSRRGGGTGQLGVDSSRTWRWPNPKGRVCTAPRRDSRSKLTPRRFRPRRGSTATTVVWTPFSSWSGFLSTSRQARVLLSILVV